MRFRLALILTVAVTLAAVAPAAAAERPIVYAIVIDGLDGDRVDQGGAPFISSLLAGQGARATYYRESRSIMIAETNPNHTAMMTGAYANESGIPGNAFAIYAPLENDDSCKRTGPVDETKLPSPTSGENRNCPVAQTVFEAIKRQGNPDGLVTAAVFGKPKLGRIFAGRNVSSKRRDVDHLWAPCASGSDDDDYCADVPTNPASGYATDDGTVMDEVIRTIREGVAAGGTPTRPDFTFVNLHQVDSAGHGFSTDTGPYDTAIALADDQVERLVNELKSRGEWKRTVLILLSDHSMDTTLQKRSLGGAFEDAGISEGDFLIIQNGSVDMVYVKNRRSSARFGLLKRLRAAALGMPGVSEALYREPNPEDGGRAHTLGAVHPGWRVAGPRTGDLLVTARTGLAFADTGREDDFLPGNHGAPQTRDNFYAVVGGGPLVRQRSLAGQRAPLFDDTAQNPGQAENADTAATVMGLFGLFATEDNAARFLGESLDLARVPGRAAPSGRPSVRLRRLSAKRSSRSARCAGRGRKRYRVSWTPAGGTYDLEVRSKTSRRTLLSASRKRSRVFSGKLGRRYSFRVRMRAASGVPSAWTTCSTGRSLPVCKSAKRRAAARRRASEPRFTG